MVRLKYEIQGNNDYHGDIIRTILERRGVENVSEFLNLTDDVVEPLENYERMQEGYDLLFKHINKDGNIHIIIDPDVDGLTSAGFMVMYLQDLEKHLGRDIKVTYHINKDKKHGILLEDKELKLSKIDLLIVPDAGSNDVKQVDKCYEKNVDVLILDHHEVGNDNDKLTKAVLINPHSSPKVKNKNISGVGVVYKFCKFVDDFLDVDFADKYLDLVALGNVADAINLREPETRYLVMKGLENINNEFLKEIAERSAFMINGEVNITALGWNIAPSLNATVRVGKPKEVKDMFEALIGVQKEIEYKTKGETEIHSLQKTMARVCSNVKGRQDRAVKKSVETINQKIKDERLDGNMILIVDVTGLLDTSYTGLVANKLASWYKKPTLLLQRVGDTEMFGGSARNCRNPYIADLNAYLTETGFFEMCQGHSNAFGVRIEPSKIKPLVEFANNDLKNIEVTDNYTVDFEIPLGRLDKSLVTTIGNAKDVWGGGIDEPVFAITNVRVNSRDIELKGTRAKDIEFKRKDITFAKRFANEDVFDEFTLKPKRGFNTGRDLNYTLIAKLKTREWQGKIYPRIEIIDYKVKEDKEIIF